MQIAEADAELKPLVARAAPELVALPGVGTETAAQLLITTGDNPGRLRSEASFARLCAAAPIPAGSGRTHRHRLNRGGDRQANNALHTIALVRMRYDTRTRDYVTRRTAEGMSKKEILLCLKRFIAREVYKRLTRPHTTPKLLLQGRLTIYRCFKPTDKWNRAPGPSRAVRCTPCPARLQPSVDAQVWTCVGSAATSIGAGVTCRGGWRSGPERHGRP